MKLRFHLSQTPAARKGYSVTPTLRASMRRAAQAVVDQEQSLAQSLDLSVVLMSDEELLALNNSSLGHDWYTDIITFEIERTVDALEAELYLSVDRAAANARKARITTEHELAHLVIHGLLHLAGYDDHETEAKKLMKRRERFYLAQV